MVSTCAFHSAAIASAISRVGRDDLAAGRRADRLAVERDGKPAIRLGDAGAGIKPLALGTRVARRTASSGSSGECPATSSNSSRMRFSAFPLESVINLGSAQYDIGGCANKADEHDEADDSAILVRWQASPLSPAQAGFRSPESLIRNVYAYYGKGASESLEGIAAQTPRPRDSSSTAACAARGPRRAMQPYDFLVQSESWKLGPVSIAILRKQFDKTYVDGRLRQSAAAPITLNFIVVKGPDGWVISDVESPHDSCGCFSRSSSAMQRADRSLPPARSRSDRTGRPRARAGSRTAAYAAAAARSRR